MALGQQVPRLSCLPRPRASCQEGQLRVETSCSTHSAMETPARIAMLTSREVDSVKARQPPSEPVVTNVSMTSPLTGS